MNDKITDQELEAYLQGDTEFSSLYSQADDVKAPEHLSFAVKRMAREAMPASTHVSSGAASKGWLLPFSLAAGIIISIAAVTLIYMQSQPVAPAHIAHDDIPPPQQLPGQPPSQLAEENPTPATAESQLAENIAQPDVTTTVKNTPATADPVTDSPVAVVPAPQKPKQQAHKPQVIVKKSTPLKKPEALPEKSNETQVATPEQPIENFELPPHLRGMLQSTRAGGSNELLPDTVLRTWTVTQWRKQITELKKAGKDKLADKYLQRFADYFPGKKLELPVENN